MSQRGWCPLLTAPHPTAAPVGTREPARGFMDCRFANHKTRRGKAPEAERLSVHCQGTLLGARAASRSHQPASETPALLPRPQPTFLTSYLVNEFEQQNGGDGFGPTPPHSWQRPSHLEAGVAKSSLVCSGTGPSPSTSATP